VLPVDPRAVGLWRLQGVVRVLTFWLPLLLAASGFASARFGALPVVALAVVLLLGIGAAALVLPSYAYARFRYGVRETDLLVEQGVMFRRTTSIPLDRIQHVDTRQGPMERVFGLSRVVVYTAAGLSADGSIPALDERTAAALRDHLARGSGRAVSERTDDGV
jgi:membrane protein YdbS with pleckstrin-like domain